jgi:hypothetical protein
MTELPKALIFMTALPEVCGWAFIYIIIFLKGEKNNG